MAGSAAIASGPSSDSTSRSSRSSSSVPFPVLLVEDKDSLRAMLRLALEGQGHAVIEARDWPGLAGLLTTDTRFALGAETRGDALAQTSALVRG